MDKIHKQDSSKLKVLTVDSRTEARKEPSF
jgi:hypothetical protein